MTRVIAVLLTLVTAAGVAAGVFTARSYYDGRKERSVLAAPVSAPVMQAPAYTVGIVSQSFPAFTAFTKSCDCTPNVAVQYIVAGDTVSGLVSHQFLLAGTTPMMEILPRNWALSDVIAGKYDAWLRSFAGMVKSQQAQILLTWAPESNGDWYSWGWKRVTTATQITAWRHVVTLFRAAGATNAKWLWLVNKAYTFAAPLNQIYPGDAYVDEIGIDAYWRYPHDTFDTVFVPSITQVQAVTKKPILITETGANSVAGQVPAISSLPAEIAKYHLGGFIWFDMNLPNPVVNEPQDFALTPAAFAIYKADVQRYERHPSS